MRISSGRASKKSSRRARRAPELKTSPDKVAICRFPVATDHGFGEKKSADWHNVVCLGKGAESCATYLRKGALVFVEGRSQTRRWQADDGSDRYTTEVVAS